MADSPGQSPSPSFDVAIIGGGMVGASLGAALGNRGIAVALIEAFAASDDQQPAYDERTVALTWSARQIFSGIGVWPDIARLGAEAIVDIHVSNRGHFGATHLSSADVGTEALGYVVPTRTIGKVLADRIAGLPSVTCYQPATASRMTHRDDRVDIELAGDGMPPRITARLAVLADGGRSGLGDAFKPESAAYEQQALLCIVTTDRPHHGRAYERFTDEGPIALLPHSERRYALVWTGHGAAVAERLALGDEDFVRALQAAFGDRAGNLSSPGPRKTYPLQRSHLDHPVGHRTVVVGNAAHTVHPVAGQGFNLGLRDIAWLAELIGEAAELGEDPGSDELLNRYAGLRKSEAKRVSEFTHGLISVFSSQVPGIRIVRNAALTAIEHLPVAKRMLLRRTMGLSGRGSALSSGSRYD